MSKVVVVSASLRANSNSEALADELIRGARDAGNEVEKISLKKKKISFCTGCLACVANGKCRIDDDAVAIARRIGEADTVVFATPTYYYGLSGILKTLLDRCNCLYASNYSFLSVYLVTSAAESDEKLLKRVEDELLGFVMCFENAKFIKTVYGTGMNDAGEAAKNEFAMQDAYNTGLQIR